MMDIPNNDLPPPLPPRAPPPTTIDEGYPWFLVTLVVALGAFLVIGVGIEAYWMS